MTITKDAILEIIKDHPGLRGREIAEYLQVHHLEIISLLDELRIEEKVQVMYRYDLANMKYYSRYYLNI
jgi:predicted ArsR family transcriptional regulator